MRIHTAFLSLLTIVLGAFVHPLTAQATTATITGTVTDSATGRPLGLVSLQIQGTSLGATTDTTGYYKIGNVTPGIITLQIRRVGYQRFNRPDFRVTAAGPNVADFSMVVQALMLTEVVRTGVIEPVAGRKVRCFCVGAPCVHEEPGSHGSPLEILFQDVSILKVKAPYLSRPTIVHFLPRPIPIRR